MEGCGENTMFSTGTKMYVLRQFYWYNLFLRIKKNRILLFEHNLHIMAFKREKHSYKRQGGADPGPVKHCTVVLKALLC